MARPDFRSQAAQRLSEERSELSPAIISLLGDDAGSRGRGGTVRNVPLDRIDPNPDQPRLTFDEDSLQELAASITEHGVLQPILVRPGTDGRYQLIAGERRWRSAQIAGLRNIPALVEEIDDETALEIAIIENLQREDLSPLDEALMYERMTTEHGYSLRKLAQKLSRRQCNAVNMVIAPSNIMHNTLRDYGVSSRIEVVPTGLPLQHFRHGNGAAFRQQYGIAANRPVALYVGRVAHEKNLPLLLQMMQLLQQRHPELLLLIAGEGPALPGLQRQAAKLGLQQRVQFVGYLDRRHGLVDCYHAADVFVFPSVTETQGLVLLEALACGKPVVAVPAMGAAEIVLAGKGAVPVEANPAAFANAVSRLLAMPGIHGQMAQQARLWADEWSDRATAARLKRHYQSLLEA